MVVTVEELQLVITAQVKEAVKNLGYARGEMSKFTQQASKDASKWKKLYEAFRQMFTGIVVTTRNMMHAIINASPSMMIAMEDMSWQFEMMSYTVGEATAPVLEALVPIIEMMAEAFVGLPQPIMMMIGVMIMATAVGGQMTMMFGPMGLAIMAIVIAVAVLAKAWQEDWGGIQGKTQAVWNVIEPIFNAVKWYFEQWAKFLKAVYDAVVWVTDKLRWLGDKMVWVKDLIDWIIKPIEAWIKVWKELIGVLEDVIGLLDDIIDAIGEVGSWLPGSLAEKGPFSKPLRMDAYFKTGIEPVKHIIEAGLKAPMAVTAPAIGGGGTTSHTTNVSYDITVNMTGGATGSVVENEVAFETVMRKIQEEMTRRVP